MTYRERRENRAARRREWAEKREAKSAGAFVRASELANSIPLGQPILVGHHSEKRARRDQDRIHNGMRKGIEHSDMALHHTEAAATIERQLDTSIYNDDHDRDEKLREKLANLEARRARIKAINSWLRKHAKEHGVLSLKAYRVTPDAGKVAALLGAVKEALELTEREVRDLLLSFQYSQTIGYSPYESTNLSGNISRTRKRLKDGSCK